VDDDAGRREDARGMGRHRTTLARAATVAAVIVAVLAVLVGLVLAWPVLSPGTQHAATASAEPEVPVPVSALGGLGVSGVLGVGLMLSFRGRHRGRGDP
jgi:hypothetical protein